MHQNADVRLSINLEPDLYALAKSLAKAEDCTVSAAVNRLLRRALPGKPPEGKSISRNGLPVVRGRVPVTAEMVKSEEEQNDLR
jgi:hypothetical protein